MKRRNLVEEVFVLSIILSLLTLSNTSVFAVEDLEPKFFEIRATDAEVRAYYEKIGEAIPIVDKSAINKVANNLTLIKEETEIDDKGRLNVIRYYKVNYKDTPEAKSIKNRIETEKVSAQLSTTSNTITPLAITPTEGDFRINIVFDPLRETARFDSSTKNYIQAFHSEKYQKALSLISGYVISSPIIGFFTDEVLEDLINGLQGKGDATGYERMVFKYGEVYHNGRWKTYYETFQKETYWKHEQFSYNNKDGSLKRATTKYYLPQTAGESYWPFMWMRTENFSKNSQIAEVALYWYSLEPDLTTPIRDFYRYEGGLENWATPGTFPY
jgi:hypothetical protein